LVTVFHFFGVYIWSWNFDLNSYLVSVTARNLIRDVQSPLLEFEALIARISWRESHRFERPNRTVGKNLQQTKRTTSLPLRLCVLLKGSFSYLLKYNIKQIVCCYVFQRQYSDEQMSQWALDPKTTPSFVIQRFAKWFHYSLLCASLSPPEQYINMITFLDRLIMWQMAWA
jgi:hypothetical protein